MVLFSPGLYMAVYHMPLVQYLTTKGRLSCRFKEAVFNRYCQMFGGLELVVEWSGYGWLVL